MGNNTRNSSCWDKRRLDIRWGNRMQTDPVNAVVGGGVKSESSGEKEGYHVTSLMWGLPVVRGIYLSLARFFGRVF